MRIRDAFEDFIEDRLNNHDDGELLTAQFEYKKLKELIFDCFVNDERVKELFIEYMDRINKITKLVYALGFRDASEIMTVSHHDNPRDN